MYQYYAHGPLARTTLGKLNVQGLDYIYTLQGWLKGVNPAMGGSLTNGTDTTEPRPIAQDVFGFSLHYYKNDYKAIWFTPQSSSVLGALTTNAKPLYNGNIAAMAVNIPQLGNTKVYNYKYDQLNRLVSLDMYNGLNPSAGSFTPAGTTEYRERISYDPNGNILTYQRNGDAARLTMDNLTYSYTAGTNRLHKVTDAAADAGAGSYANYNDLRTGQANNNYGYDSIGNLIRDTRDSISNISWTVYGKIASITKNEQFIRYTYDAAGNRISKQTATDTTFYVRDATGNVMSVYLKPAGGSLRQEEVHLYGSSRLGIATRHLASDTSINLAAGFGTIKGVKFTRGEKLFELSNHLGNVLVTISDRMIQQKQTGDTVRYYQADVVSANDYYPFGMLMPGRKFSAGVYRYGFNGKENDNEVKGVGNQQDYGMRIYDTRLGRFLSVDPITMQYPMLTPYQFASNTPIQAIDFDGLEAVVTTFYYQSQKDAKVKVVNSNIVVNNTKPRSETIMINLDGRNYMANSYMTLQGRDDKYKFNGDFRDIRDLSTEDIAGIRGYADVVFDVIYGKNFKEHAVLYESGAGPLKNSNGLLDFKNSLYALFNFKPDELIGIDGVAYNANEAGNYLWGMVLHEAGIVLNAKTIAELGTKGRNDEPHEQKAIQAGIDKANSFKKGDGQRWRLKAFEFYREEYYNAEEGVPYKPSDNLGIFKQNRENEKTKE
ncbi:RHS repeat domain-containing protein [Flavihumibacter stibioxidans]|uniref:RHS repeat-associated core domain-containing protein n=2 Tax=Flavihumibacter stibioxidans TaxID=1834163 RepID=A0ABR7M6J1_9BACT|nr:hypothetical protein [Flavihumibacter stibioxidans]